MFCHFRIVFIFFSHEGYCSNFLDQVSCHTGTLFLELTLQHANELAFLSLSLSCFFSLRLRVCLWCLRFEVRGAEEEVSPLHLL